MKIEKTKIQIRTLVSGAILDIPVFTISGESSGKTVYIQSSIHGSELQGNAVIYKLMNYLEKIHLKGKIILAPVANPYGVDMKLGEYSFGRFDPTTGENWNRFYWRSVCKSKTDKSDELQIDLSEFIKRHKNKSWEYIQSSFKQLMKTAISSKLKQSNPFGKKMALELQLLAAEADIVLDLHCASVSKEHLYTPEYALDSAKNFKFPYYIVIPNEFAGALDEAAFCPWWDLYEALKVAKMPGANIDFQAFTLELGNQDAISFDAAEMQAKNILNYLQSMKIISGFKEKVPAPQQIACDLASYRSLYMPYAGMVDFSIAMGAKVKAGGVLGQALNMIELRKSTVAKSAVFKLLAEADCIPIVRASSAAIHEGSEYMRVMEKYRVL